MARILGIDYGIKNCGIAVTDPLQIIVSSLKTVKTASFLNFLQLYLQDEEVEKIIFGIPTHKDGNPTYVVSYIEKLAEEIRTKYPELIIDFQNENFSSVQAKEIIYNSGLNKKQRQDKSRIDKISAVIILQRYLKHI